MIREELEFRIAQYADGTLPPGQRSAVEAELAADAEARALLADYRQLQQAAGAAAALPLPNVRWDQLADRVSAAVTESSAEPSTTAPATPATPSGQLDERAEFAIACYADGTLSVERRGEVEQLLAADERARALLDEYENLDATAKAVAYNAPFPPLDWDRLALHISETVEAGAGATLAEASEQQLADYAQGALPAGRREEVEARLASAPAARIAVSEYRNLDAALAALPTAVPLPPLNWEQLAGRISAAVDAVDASDGAGAAERTLRIAPVDYEPVGAVGAGRERGRAGSYRIWSWLRSPAAWAAAASVLIAAGIGAGLLRHRRGPVVPPGVVAAAPQIEVDGPAAEAPAGSAVAEVEIRPPSQVAQGGADMAEESGDGVVSSPPRAFVASGQTSRESDVLPAMPF